MGENKTFSVQVSTTSAKKIGVSSNVSENPITATSDTGLYYSQLSKNWAIGEGLIENTDYSSKAYAQESKAYALDSKAYSESASLDLNNLNNAITQYNEQITNTVATGLAEITTLQESSLVEIGTLRTNAVEDIATNKTNALFDITSAENNALANIETDLNNATSEINTNRTNTLAQISTLANTSISDINATAKSYDNVTYRNITNCLLEVPQRIKYTLENGTLTIKAGSVVIVPYGTEDKTSEFPVGATFLYDSLKVYDTQFNDGKFFVWVEILSDIQRNSFSTNGNALIFINFNNSGNGSTGLGQAAIGAVSSGTSDPNTGYYYRTNENKVYHLGNWYGYSFPIMVGLANGTTLTSIDPVFNGIGYIGSTIWVDKGVKFLLPDGRNEDETLKNIEYVPAKILMYDITKSFSAAQSLTLMIENDNTLGATNSARCLSGYSLPATVSNTSYHLFYNIRENKHYRTSGSTTANWVEIPKCIIGNVYFDGTNLTSFNPKQPFRAVDYNDKPEISGWGMPSDKYISLTLGATGSTYTAPANGWYWLQVKSNANNQYIGFRANGIYLQDAKYSSGADLTLLMPVTKGDTFMVTYNTSNAPAYFRFIYAQGEE